MNTHPTHADDIPELACDLLVVGGGINGAGIARDAAGRGLSVVLCEKDDLAAHTSSSSTKLIHGGLRYLEHYEFRLVRKALQEREVLMRSAPHLIRPIRFVMPHDASQRPAWMIRAGLFLYDHLARRELLPGSGAIDLRRHVAGVPLKPGFARGFVYSDATVDDARLVVSNALDAAERGAKIFTRTMCESAERGAEFWRAVLRHVDGHITGLRARCIVNAAGPWVTHFQNKVLPEDRHSHVRLVKGSHIVVRKLFDHPYAYIFQHPDRRIVFAIPYESEFTLIGTTDVEFQGNPDEVQIDADEIEYLCGLCKYYFRRSVAAGEILWSYAGVRPLVDDAAADPSTVTRDYHFGIDTHGAPLLSVFGGKITTFRRLAEDAVNTVSVWLENSRGAWTAEACLPGGDLDGTLPSNRVVLDLGRLFARYREEFDWLPEPLAKRFLRAYGTRVRKLLAGCSCLTDLGQELVPGLFEVECQYLMRYEWALTASDLLWRRSKLGLHCTAAQQDRLEDWIAQQRVAAKIAQEPCG